MSTKLSVVTSVPALDKSLKLKPRMHDRVRRFLSNAEQVLDLADALGSPLNVMFPQNIDKNIADFQKVYEAFGLAGRIYVSTKPNKSLSALRQAALHDVGIDVSSEGALKTALMAGFPPDRIECTGPKNIDYLSLAVQQGVTLNADNLEELHQILTIRKAAGAQKKTKLFVRLSGFHSPRMKFTPHDSTFGVHVDQTDEVFSFLSVHADDFEFQGFSFHFNSKVIEQKTIAIENVLQKTVEAIKRGFKPRGINIGGGFDIRYADDLQEWKEYIDTIKQSLRNYGPSLTWNDNGLGYRFEDGLIKGAPSYFEHGIVRTGADDLSDILGLTLPAFENMTVAEVVSDFLLELYVEPGRSMFDQLGITIGRVNHVKTSAHGETLVALDMNRTNINSSQQKLLTDPVILYKDTNRKPCPQGLYYVGNLCLSYDMLTYNKTFPDLQPEAGDLVAFINTAAYMMDFNESETLYQSVAQKIAVIEAGDKFKWFQDQVYNPVAYKLSAGEKK